VLEFGMFIKSASTSLNSGSLERLVTPAEILHALQKEANRKSPNIDGINSEFYADTCDTIKQDLVELINNMFLNKKITSRQKHAIIFCLPKSTVTHTKEHF
jgi:hypothetical protein